MTVHQLTEARGRPRLYLAARPDGHPTEVTRRDAEQAATAAFVAGDHESEQHWRRIVAAIDTTTGAPA